MSDEGYEFTPLAPTVRRTARGRAQHDHVVPSTITATLTFQLVAEQQIHVGSGFKSLCDGQIARAAMTSAGVACIPGSTLKGVLRSRFEAITKSCALFPAKGRTVKIRSSSYPHAKARFDEEITHRDAFKVCRENDTCPACALFGRMSLRSRVSVSDFVTATEVSFEIAEVAEMFSPNLHHVGKFEERSDNGQQVLVVTNLHGRKFARGRGPEMPSRERIEVIPSGTVLNGTVRLVNVEESEFGGLLAALGVSPSSRLKVGGGKGHGFGRARIERLVVTPRPASRVVATPLDVYTEKFLSSDDAWQPGLNALMNIHAAERKP
jgi:CRISPR/Cas system CSM-associated protein Csm3 (group 7 of RAMP superfamily)